MRHFNIPKLKWNHKAILKLQKKNSNASFNFALRINIFLKCDLTSHSNCLLSSSMACPSLHHIQYYCTHCTRSSAVIHYYMLINSMQLLIFLSADLLQLKMSPPKWNGQCTSTSVADHTRVSVWYFLNDFLWHL